MIRVLKDGKETLLSPHFSSELNEFNPSVLRVGGLGQKLVCMAAIENGRPVAAFTLPRAALKTKGAKFRTGGHDWEVL